MTPRRIVDLAFMSLVLVTGLAGVAHACVHPNLPELTRASITDEAASRHGSCATARRVPRGDDARQRTRETVQFAVRGTTARA